MKIRSTVSSDISRHVIWVNSIDFDSTVKEHEILVNEFGYTDSLILEEGNRGKGVSVSVCENTALLPKSVEPFSSPAI